MKKVEIFVISKGRPNGKTSMLLSLGNVEHKIVVEPQDFDAYCKFGHSKEKLEVLPKNNRGFSYVVNFCKNKFVDNPILILDDDIMSFFYSLDGINKCGLSLKTSEEIKQFFENFSYDILNTDFDIGTMGKSAFDWSFVDVSPKVAFPGSKIKYSSLSVCIIIKTAKCLLFDFDETLPFKSDIDYSLKCMYLGLKYAKFVKYLQQTKMNKELKQTGGLSESYSKIENIKKVNNILLKRWPNNIIVDEKKKPLNGISELKIIYKVFDDLDLSKIEA